MMLVHTVKTWFTRSSGLPPLLEPALADAIGRLPETDGKPVAPLRPSSEAWPCDRLTVAELLWGEGCVRPGGAAEVVRLGRPLVGTNWSSVMLLGAGPGGAALAIAAELGLWVSAFEADPALAEISAERHRGTPFAKRIETKTWDPWNPTFGSTTFHHAICLEPLRGAPAVPVLTACAGALRPAAQLVFTELVVDEQLDARDPAVAAWARLEPTRGLVMPSEREITRALSRLGFDVRVAEDITERHVHLCLLGWRVLVRELRRDNLPMSQAYWMVREAEMWLNRIKLMQQGRMRLVRWHALARAAAPTLGGPN